MLPLSVVIVTYRTRDLVLGCLRSLRAPGGDFPCDVFVVDNASADGTVDAVGREFPSVALLEMPANLGFGRAVNRALADVRTPFTLVLNADTVAYPGAVEAMLQYMQDHPRVGALGCRLVDAEGFTQPTCYKDVSLVKVLSVALGIREWFPYVFLGRFRADGWLRRLADFPDHDREQHPDWFHGGVVLYRTDVLREAGGYDEDYFVYFDEIDVMYRLQAAGYDLAYTPEATFVHHGSVSSEFAHERMTLTYWRSWFTFYRKHHPELVEGLRFLMVLGTLLRLPFLLVRLASGQRKYRQIFTTACAVIRMGLRGDG